MPGGCDNPTAALVTDPLPAPAVPAIHRADPLAGSLADPLADPLGRLVDRPHLDSSRARRVARPVSSTPQATPSVTTS
jgi:hypothetical protein